MFLKNDGINNDVMELLLHRKPSDFEADDYAEICVQLLLTVKQWQIKFVETGVCPRINRFLIRIR